MDISRFEKKKVVEFPSQVDTNPIVSVIILAHNHAPYIRQCLEGVLGQVTNFSYEVVVGEDESNDGTRLVCIEYAKMYPQKIRLFLHHRENNISIYGRPTGRFNFLFNLKSARGKYISLCDGDDYWTDPHKLQKQVDFLETNKDYSYSFHDVKVVDNLIVTDKYKSKTSTGTNYPHTSALCYRNCIEIPPEFLQSCGGDVFLIFLLKKVGKGCYLGDIRENYYRVHSGGIISTATRKIRLGRRLNTLEAIYSYLKRIGDRHEQKFYNGKLIKVVVRNIKYNFTISHVVRLLTLVFERFKLLYILSNSKHR